MGYPEDPDIKRAPPLNEQLAGTMFAPDRSPPAPRNEQRVLPIRKATIEGDYRAWLATVDGERVFHEFCKQAREEHEAGAARLSAKGIWEMIRRKLRIEMNNNFHGPMVRDCEDRHPELVGLFEKRRRKTA